jgi:hypothetical protein
MALEGPPLLLLVRIRVSRGFKLNRRRASPPLLLKQVMPMLSPRLASILAGQQGEPKRDQHKDQQQGFAVFGLGAGLGERRLCDVYVGAELGRGYRGGGAGGRGQRGGSVGQGQAGMGGGGWGRLGRFLGGFVGGFLWGFLGWGDGTCLLVVVLIPQIIDHGLFLFAFLNLWLFIIKIFLLSLFWNINLILTKITSSISLYISIRMSIIRRLIGLSSRASGARLSRSCNFGSDNNLDDIVPLLIPLADDEGGGVVGQRLRDMDYGLGPGTGEQGQENHNRLWAGRKAGGARCQRL